MDEADRAQQLQELQLRVALSRVLPAKTAKNTGLHREKRCEDCGETIPPARLRAAPGAVCCIQCQQARER